ncbi:hypothetical protein DITRI_Ditri01bG0095200 [Diplodiscus trichospermus]
MMLLVYTRRKLESFDNGYSKLASFGDLGFAVCGTVGRFVVDVLIILSQAGFGVGYLIFISSTLANLLNNEKSMSSSLSLGMSSFTAKSLYIWGCFPFQLGLNSIATLTHFAPLSIFADVVDLGAMGVVLIEDLSLILKQRHEVMAFGGLSVFFYGMGVAVYTFEGIGMVLPIESEMKDNAKFGKILALSMALFVPNFADFLSLIGSSVCCGLGFVLPALFHLLVFKEELGWKGWTLDVGIVALGLVLGVSGTWYALMEIFSVKV